MNEIILIGDGGHARSCIDVIELSGLFKIVGLVRKGKLNNKECLGYPIIGSDDDLPNLREKYSHSLITVGQIISPEKRMRLYQLLKGMDYTLPIIISPRAHLSKHSQIGEGTIIMHGSVVNAGAKIGINCIINSQSLIEHDVVIGDHCHVSTGAILNGKVRIGKGSFIGSRVVIKQDIKIGQNCVIGFGSVVNKNIADNILVKN